MGKFALGIYLMDREFNIPPPINLEAFTPDPWWGTRAQPLLLSTRLFFSLTHIWCLSTSISTIDLRVCNGKTTVAFEFDKLDRLTSELALSSSSFIERVMLWEVFNYWGDLGGTNGYCGYEGMKWLASRGGGNSERDMRGTATGGGVGFY